MSQKRKVILCGFGSVGKAFIKLLADKEAQIKNKYGLQFEVCAVVDSAGAVIAKSGGLQLQNLIDFFKSGEKLSEYKSIGHRRIMGEEVIQMCRADVIIETFT